MSFGFKYGIPLDADIVLDMRFLPNPYWVPELRASTGLDEEVSDYVLSLPEAERLPGRATSRPGAGARGLPARGQDLRHDRRRLHRRQAPLGGDHRGAGPAAGDDGVRRRAPCTATWGWSRPCEAAGLGHGSGTAGRGRGSSRSAAATAWPPRCRRCACSPTRSPPWSRSPTTAAPAAGCARARRAAARRPADGAVRAVRRHRVGPHLARPAAAPVRQRRRAAQPRRRQPADRRAVGAARRHGHRAGLGGPAARARGRVLPMAAVPLDIEADVVGSTRRPAGRPWCAARSPSPRTPGRVVGIRLTPQEPPACPEAVAAIARRRLGRPRPGVVVHQRAAAPAGARAGRGAAEHHGAAHRGPQPGRRRRRDRGFSRGEPPRGAGRRTRPACRFDVVLADRGRSRTSTPLADVAASLGARLVLRRSGPTPTAAPGTTRCGWRPLSATSWSTAGATSECLPDDRPAHERPAPVASVTGCAAGRTRRRTRRGASTAARSARAGPQAGGPHGGRAGFGGRMAPMALTALVKDELSRLTIIKPC